MAISPALTSFDHPSTPVECDFHPPPDPPIFMGPDCKAPRGRVFLLLQFFHTKTQKITKNARIIQYLCVHKFFHEQKKTHFFTKKNVARSLFVCSEPESSRAIFESKKNEKKRAKNKFSKYIWAPKMLQKSCIFHQK